MLYRWRMTQLMVSSSRKDHTLMPCWLGYGWWWCWYRWLVGYLKECSGSTGIGCHGSSSIGFLYLVDMVMVVLFPSSSSELLSTVGGEVPDNLIKYHCMTTHTRSKYNKRRSNVKKRFRKKMKGVIRRDPDVLLYQEPSSSRKKKLFLSFCYFAFPAPMGLLRIANDTWSMDASWPEKAVG